MQNIFIWGSYDYANFGDDLMALIIADFCKVRGCSVKVYRLSEVTASQHNLISENNLRRGIEWADLVVLGGGAVFGELVGHEEVKKAYEEDIGQLVDNAETFRKRMVALSVGVGSLGRPPNWTPNQVRLKSSPWLSAATVRLQNDVKHLRADSRFTYVPDIVYLTRSNEKSSSAITKLYWNIPKLTRSGSLERWLCKLIARAIGLEAVFLSVYGSAISAEKVKIATKEVIEPTYVPFDTPDELVTRLAREPGLIVSSKLHLGIAAIALGNIFISVRGKAKTKLALDEAGLSEFVAAGPLSLVKLLFQLRTNARRVVAAEKVAVIVNKLADDANSHWEILEGIMIENEPNLH